MAKYFAILPAAFVAVYPELGALNVMRLATPQSAILSAVIFNALIIIALIPLALRGVRYRPRGASELLRRHLLIYGVGGLVGAVRRHQGHRPDPSGDGPLPGDAMKATLRAALSLLALLTLITGILYPLAVTGLAGALFPGRARGSLLAWHGRIVGSELIGQSFTDPRYFRGRPSATTPPYNAAASSGSNLGPANPALADSIRARLVRLDSTAPAPPTPVPVDLVTSSGSGLDPDMSPAAAWFQVPRVARLRGIDEARVRALVARHITGRQFGILGEPRVNVLRLNLALDELSGVTGTVPPPPAR